MNQPDPKFDAYVLRVYEVLDHLDYYRLVGAEPGDDIKKIRTSFLAMAARFHPDRNREAAPNIRAALYHIFKRLNEAYRVLCDPQRRPLYDEALRQGKPRLEQDLRRATLLKTPEDSIKNLQARQFYTQAVGELKQGNLKNADLHAKVALGREPGNPVITALANQIVKAKADAKK